MKIDLDGCDYFFTPYLLIAICSKKYIDMHFYIINVHNFNQTLMKILKVWMADLALLLTTEI